MPESIIPITREMIANVQHLRQVVHVLLVAFVCTLTGELDSARADIADVRVFVARMCGRYGPSNRINPHSTAHDILADIWIACASGDRWWRRRNRECVVAETR